MLLVKADRVYIVFFTASRVVVCSIFIIFGSGAKIVMSLGVLSV